MTPLIVALDFDNTEDAWKLVDSLGSGADFFKVGMELYAAGGLQFVRDLRKAGKRVFLDLKLYDIGETVKRATKLICESLDISFLTVHGSESVMRSAAEGRGRSATELLAVTVLTSFDQKDLADLGYETNINSLVELRVHKAIASGMNGVVCSPLEVARVREIGGNKLKLIVPGIRSTGSAHGDQKRVATPADAMKSGADYLVIGRQVTRSSDPKRAFQEIAAELPM